MKKIAFLFFLTIGSAMLYAERPFYAFDNGLTRTKSPEAQAKLLKELGYDGICSRPGKCTDELIQAFDREGVKIGCSFMVLDAASETLPPFVEKNFKQLKGRDTLIWLNLSNKKASMESAVKLTPRPDTGWMWPFTAIWTVLRNASPPVWKS